MPEVLYLTNREKEIVNLISLEFTNTEIAMYLNIVVGTVEVHRKNIFKKTGARNMAGLMRWGFENGVLEVG
ncbi:MAG: LuxR C-terminal-related transcriptional regulator [Saprospiraceae bacterium]